MSGILLFKHNALFVHSIHIALRGAVRIHLVGELEDWTRGKGDIVGLVSRDTYNALGTVPGRQWKHLPAARQETITHGGQ